MAWRTVGSIVTRSTRTSTRPSIVSTDYGGSGSTRSPTSAATGISSWWLTTTAADWCGRDQAATTPRSACSSMSSVPSEPPYSPMFRRIWRTGSPELSRRGHLTRCVAPTRSMSSHGRSRPSTSNGGEHGTKPKVVARPRGLARQGRSTGDAQHISQARYALWKNPSDLTGRQRHQLDWIAKTDPRLWHAYLLKEGLRYVFAVKGDEGKQALDRWASWARRSRMPAFVQLQRRITAHRPAIDAALDTGLSQGLVESTNTKIRLLHAHCLRVPRIPTPRRATMLALGSHPPRLPGRH